MAERPAQDGRTLAWVVRWVGASAIRRGTKEARENGGIHRRHVMLPIGPADSPARSRAHSRPRPAKPFGTNRHNPNQRLLPEDHRQARPLWTHCEKPDGFRPRLGGFGEVYEGHFHVTTWVSRKCRSADLKISPRRSAGEDWTCRVSIKQNNTQ